MQPPLPEPAPDDVSDGAAGPGIHHLPTSLPKKQPSMYAPPAAPTVPYPHMGMGGGLAPNMQPPSGPSQMYQPSTADASRSSVRRKLDPKNPLNEEGKVMKGHPKYFEVMGQAQRFVEHALTEMQFKNGLRARAELERVLELLNKLEA